MTTRNTTPQTVGFTLRVFYCHADRPISQPYYVDYTFHSFQKMWNRYGTERRRRAYADRATSGQYKMFLTDYGRAMVNADEVCRDRHADAIDGTWFDAGHQVYRAIAGV
jgi:hypothetical protein